MIRKSIGDGIEPFTLRRAMNVFGNYYSELNRTNHPRPF